MSHTFIHHPRTSTRGHAAHHIATHKRHPSIKIITDITQSPSSPTLSSSSLSSSRTHAPHAPEPPSPNYHQHQHLTRRTSLTRERHISAHIIERSPDSYPSTASRRTPTPSSSRTKTLPRIQDLTIVQRSNSSHHDDFETQEELARYYQHQALAHRQHSQSSSPRTLPRRHNADLPLVLAEHPHHYGRELVRADSYRHGAYIVERGPDPEPRRIKSVKKNVHFEPVVVEKKQVFVMRDEAGRLVKVKRVVR